jgi:hypothetical protein
MRITYDLQAAEDSGLGNVRCQVDAGILIPAVEFPVCRGGPVKRWHGQPGQSTDRHRPAMTIPEISKEPIFP